MTSNFKKTTLILAISATLSVSDTIQADVVTLSWSGAYTWLNSGGGIVYNTDTANCYPGMALSTNQCSRTAITGTLTIDTATGAGVTTIAPFSFWGAGFNSITSISLQAIGNGAGGPGSLILGNMLWNWNSNNSVPVSIVWDASGLFSALGGEVTIGQTITGGALPATDNTIGTPSLGPAVFATATWNTTNIGIVSLGSNPSGTLPLVTDTVVDATNGDVGIGGSPMRAGPFSSYNVNIDIISMHVINTTRHNGDINGDGMVNMADVILAQRYLSGLITLTPEQINRGDAAPLVNGAPTGNGVFNTGDLLVIQQKVLGKISF